MFQESTREDATGEVRAFLPYLSAYLRQMAPRDSRARIAVPENWMEYAAVHKTTPISQRVRRLRELIAERSDKVGVEIHLDEREVAPWIDARDFYEVAFYLKYLANEKQITLHYQDIPSQQRNSTTGRWANVQLQIPGWDAVSPVAGTGVLGTCFVAMSFDRSLDEAYDKGIVPAVSTDCGFDIIRVDRVQHNDDITDRILAGIRTAQFVVADFSKQRQGVYFEAGFAAGLGRPVIWTCRAKDFARLHFDTRQRNHIKWTSPEELRDQLATRIKATIALPARLTMVRRRK